MEFNNLKIIDSQKYKICSSSDYNFIFNKENGFFARWGKTREEDPVYAPSAEILDLEISAGSIGTEQEMCKGRCQFCYKNNNEGTEPIHNMTFEEFKTKLKSAKTEETVKAIYAKYFKIDYDTADKHDLYTPQVLFEFKYDKNFQNLKALATILAQSLYYIRRLKYEDTQKTIPYFLCLADKNEASLTETNKCQVIIQMTLTIGNALQANPTQNLLTTL